MKKQSSKKHLSLILIMLITTVSLLLSGCGKTETTETDSGDKQIYINKIAGSYDVAEGQKDIGSWWHLDIYGKKLPKDIDVESKEEEESIKNTLDIYDQEAGNPGVGGKIVSIDKEKIKIEIDLEYYDELPSPKWKDENGEYLELTYKLTNKGIELTNNNSTIQFIR